MALRRRLTPALLTLALFAGVLSQGPGAHGQESDPLVESSLDALGKLVTPETCTKKDAADGNVENGIELLYVFCDDGVPPSGGGAAGIPVPAKYAATKGNDWSGLPAPAGAAETAEAAAKDDIRPEGDNHITLDVDITLPPSAASVLYPEDPPRGAPAGGNPVIVFMHGCCGGNKTSWEAGSIDAANEHWHHSNAWFAARGYVVVNYTARGFRNSMDRGSTGSTQLDSRRYEINDYQYLVGLLSDLDRQRKAADLPPLFMINPRKVGAVGGSYGGGFAWLALTDPTWKSPLHKTKLKLG
ncbi:MAG: CocE/NonD family hydrolase, partial [Actinobacteria bacterium]|nr:CocE/NonD family hydrolase [Actinomycetota bacterium]